MKVKLLQDSRREGKAGEIVDVSPERLAFLMSISAAKAVDIVGEQAKPPKAADGKAEKRPEPMKPPKPPKPAKPAKPAPKKPPVKK